MPATKHNLEIITREYGAASEAVTDHSTTGESRNAPFRAKTVMLRADVGAELAGVAPGAHAVPGSAGTANLGMAAREDLRI